MKRLIFSTTIFLSLAACTNDAGEDLAMDTASSALEEAQRANRALDDGAASGTTMGTELEELQHRMDALEAENRQLQAEADGLESQVSSLEAKIDYAESQQRY